MSKAQENDRKAVGWMCLAGKDMLRVSVQMLEFMDRAANGGDEAAIKAMLTTMDEARNKMMRAQVLFDMAKKSGSS